MKRLWFAFIGVIVVSFAVLGWIGVRIYQEAPPVPDRVETTDGRVVIDANVIGPDGNPIPGLTSENFRVQIDGRPVILESVEWLPAAKPETAALTMPQRKGFGMWMKGVAFSNRVPLVGINQKKSFSH